MVITTLSFLILTGIISIIEAYAAKEAGLEVAVLVRPGNAALTFDGSDELPTLQSFDECISE